jgi:hypothetical protein
LNGHEFLSPGLRALKFREQHGLTGSAAAEERPAAAERQVKMENNCSICLRRFMEFGNNAWPINNGRCCNVCNDNVVIPARIRMQRRKETEAKDQPPGSAPKKISEPKR